MNPPRTLPALPREPIHRFTTPIKHYLHIEAAGGIVLLLATIVALFFGNSPWADAYHHFWHTPVGMTIGEWRIEHSLEHWINDGLMVLFFFLIGLEVKYELILGELRDTRQAILPIMAAIGGMVVPAGVFLAIQHEGSAARGWGIPMATDIAFVVGIMAVLGKRVPHGLRVMLLTLAIADDIGAILVIAVGYSTGVDLTALAWAGAGLVTIAAMARLGVRAFLPYIIMGVLVWYAFLVSGVHATLAGVLIGLMTPARHYVGPELFREFLDSSATLITAEETPEQRRLLEQANRLRQAARETVSPLAYLQTLLHPWVTFLVLPIFALANAGVTIDFAQLASPLALAVMLGLLVGKPVGVFVMSWLSIKLRIASLPARTNWARLIGGACLTGIGFTMALFIANLAMTDTQQLAQAKLGVLTGSVLSAVLGMGILWWLPVPTGEVVE